MNNKTERQVENLELAERFAVALRFHDQPERAEQYEQLAVEIREGLLADDSCEGLA